MSKRKIDRFWVFLAILMVTVLVPVVLHYAPLENAKRHTEAEYFIESLHSENRAIHLSDHGELPKISKEEEHEEERIKSILRALGPNVEVLADALCRNMDDNRYSVTLSNADERYSNWTIGDICHDVLSESLSYAYFRHFKDSGSVWIYSRLQIPKFAKDRKSLNQWLNERNNHQFFELQIEACNSALQVLEENKPKDGPPEYLEDTPKSRLEKAKEFERIESTIRKEIESLKTTRKSVMLEHWLDVYQDRS